MKICRGCSETKPLADFGAHPGFKDGRNSKCKACKDAQRRESIAAGRAQKHTPYSYKRQLKSKYGLTVEAYDAMLEKCKGCCHLCGSAGKLNVDHCHSTGAVRGLLCTACNTGLGKLGDTRESLLAALRYLDGESTGS